MEAIEKATLKTRDNRKVKEAQEAKSQKKQEKVETAVKSKQEIQAEYQKKLKVKK